MDPLKSRLCVLGISLFLYMGITELSERDWRNEVSTSETEKILKILMHLGCCVPGLRLMCSPDGMPFQLRNLTLLDTVLGCFFYSLFFITFLWFMTPFPNIKVFLVLVTDFLPRSPEDQQPVAMNLPTWHPAGGEGPANMPL